MDVKSPSLQTHSEGLSQYGSFQLQTVKNDFCTPKPLDTENKEKSCNCYQIDLGDAGIPKEYGIFAN